jgi:predicted hotdog family 3-hydroxylacyl-ACP dehydratase
MPTANCFLAIIAPPQTSGSYVLGKEQIRQLLPHGGSMCLIDEVLEWSKSSIECRTATHRDADNPLRHQGVLPIHAAIEYGAQAAGIHGGLADHGGVARRGYLAVLSSVEWRGTRLDLLPAPLTIFAERQVTSAIGTMYRFKVAPPDESDPIVQGQIVIAFEPDL